MMMYSTRSRRQMLTQQQRNNKRQRANPQQLAYLRKMFSEDSKPDQKKRERIGKQIDMTPRSVQIWFQNNRAKAKTLERKVGGSRFSTVTTYYSDKISGVHFDYSHTDDYYSPETSRTATPTSMVPMSYGNTPTHHWTSARNFSDVPSSPAYSVSRHHYSSSPLRRQATVTRDITSLFDPGLDDGSIATFDSDNGGQQANDLMNMVELSVCGLSLGNWHRGSFASQSYDEILNVSYTSLLNRLEYRFTDHRNCFSISFEVPLLSLESLRPSAANPSMGYLVMEIQSRPIINMIITDPNGQQSWQSCVDFTNGAMMSGQTLQLVGRYSDLVQGVRTIRGLQIQARASTQSASSTPSLMSGYASSNVTPPPESYSADTNLDAGEFDDDIDDLFEEPLYHEDSEGSNPVEQDADQAEDKKDDEDDATAELNNVEESTKIEGYTSNLFPLDIDSLTTIESLSVPISPCQVSNDVSRRSYSDNFVNDSTAADSISQLRAANRKLSEPRPVREYQLREVGLEVSPSMLAGNFEQKQQSIDQLFMLLGDAHLDPTRPNPDDDVFDLELDQLNVNEVHVELAQW